MKLTKGQRALLALYREYHTKGISLGTAYRKVRFGYLILIGYCVAAFALFQSLGIPWCAWLIAGIGAGTILRDGVYVRRTWRVWPVVEEITDWQRVGQLLAEGTPGGPPAEGEAGTP